ncbi:MAG: formyltransferase family protein [Candidatus Omnitrophica bacterium]|nr:formyltransferase family protein [Candidatus Omnitrophota bacterium]
MRIAIIGQEEPVYFSPFLRSIIEARPKEVVLAVIAGKRGAGSHPKTFRQKLENIYALWLIMEPCGFARNLLLGVWQNFVRLLGPLGACLDKRSIYGAARKYNIPVINCCNLNSRDFIERLKGFSPDIIINQTELLLEDEILSAPKIGIINRHASLLPHFRGRLASFWSHAAEPPEYGVTIHFVDKEIDSGPIIVQKKYSINPRMGYSKVLDILFSDALSLMLEALEKVQEPGFAPIANQYQGTSTYLFPSLKQARAYRATLKKRRRGFKS